MVSFNLERNFQAGFQSVQCRMLLGELPAPFYGEPPARDQ
jgi:hypothetical protein